MFEHPFPLRSAPEPSVPPNSLGAFHSKSTHVDHPPSILPQSEVRWYALRGHAPGLPCCHCPTPAAPASSMCLTGSNLAGTPSQLHLLCSRSEGLASSAAHCRPCLRRHGGSPPSFSGHLHKLSNVPSTGASALVVGKLWPFVFSDTPFFRIPAGDLEFSSAGVAIGCCAALPIPCCKHRQAMILQTGVVHHVHLRCMWPTASLPCPAQPGSHTQAMAVLSTHGYQLRCGCSRLSCACHTMGC